MDELMRSWLSTLVLAGEPTGNVLRVRLRHRLAAAVASGDERLAEFARDQAARLAARTPEQIREDAERAEQFRRLSPISIGRSRRRHRRAELPGELTEDCMLERLAVLGADLGEEGEQLLRRVATDEPQNLAPAVEEPFTGHGLAAYRPTLLTDLIEAYYLDEDDEDAYYGLGETGIRNHSSTIPRTRVKLLTGPPRRQRDSDDDRYYADLAITGGRHPVHWRRPRLALVPGHGCLPMHERAAGTRAGVRRVH
ncbi:MAG: hypothetical protein ACRDJ4_13480 [Actinomycetota bacterium]